MVRRYRVTVPLVQIEFDLVGWRGGRPVEVLRQKRLTFQQYEALRVCENIALQIPSYSRTYYPIENWSSANFHCEALLENNNSKIDLRPQKRSSCAETYVRDHFNLLWCQFTNMHNLQAKQQPHTWGPPVPSPRRMAAFPLSEEHGVSPTALSNVCWHYSTRHAGGCQAQSAASWRIY